MTAYINKLKDKTGNQQLPVTHERAVRDSEGTTLETKLQNLEGAMDKAYVASSDNGMGRITLKKNMVSGVNTLTQSMMQATNTIFVIQYDFTLGEDITVPANCVLEFDGGSIDGIDSDDISINLNNSILSGIPLIKNCQITNPYKKQICLSWLGLNNTEYSYNVKTLSWLAIKPIDWIVDTNITINSVIKIKQPISIIGKTTNAVDRYTITATESAALKFHLEQYFNSSVISDFNIVSEEDCIEFCCYVSGLTIERMKLRSYTGICLHFHDEKTNVTEDGETYMYYNFSNYVRSCYLEADNGYGVSGMASNTNHIDSVKNGYCVAVFHNCYALFTNCNGSFRTTRRGDSEQKSAEHALLFDEDRSDYNIILTFINCNFEDYTKEAIIDTNETKARVYNITFINTSIYTYKTSGTRLYAGIKLNRLKVITCTNDLFKGGIDNFASGVSPIMTSYRYDENYNPCTLIGFRVNYDVICNSVLIGNTNRTPNLGDTNNRPTGIARGYYYYDSTLNKPIWWNGTNWVDATGATV